MRDLLTRANTCFSVLNLELFEVHQIYRNVMPVMQVLITERGLILDMIHEMLFVRPISVQKIALWELQLSNVESHQASRARLRTVQTMYGESIYAQGL